MTALIVDIFELNETLRELLERVEKDSEIIITDKGKPVAVITKLAEFSISKRRQIGLTKGEAWMNPDFDEPLEDFTEYMP